MTITKQELVHWCAGGPKRKSRLARMLGCNRQLINRWTTTDTRIAERWQEELRTQMHNIELIERQHAEVVRQLAALREREIILRTA